MSEAVAAKLEQIATELRRKLLLATFVMTGSDVALELGPVTAGETGEILQGEVRLRFRDTFDSNRFAFQCQAKFQKRMTRSDFGFSGFLLNGQVVWDSQQALKLTGFVMLYNSDEWLDWR